MRVMAPKITKKQRNHLGITDVRLILPQTLRKFFVCYIEPAKHIYAAINTIYWIFLFITECPFKVRIIMNLTYVRSFWKIYSK